MITMAIVETPHGGAYLEKLCRHFARQVPVTLTRTQGRIEFTYGPCRIDVGDKQMQISIEVNDDHQVSTAEKILEEHLLRIASRDQPSIEWHRGSLYFQGRQTL